MYAVAPDTTTRLSLDELAGLTFAWSPASVRLSFLSDGTELEWDGPFGDQDVSLPLSGRCPELVRCEWEISGVTVSAALDVVAQRVCSIEDIKWYRPREYDLSEVPDYRAFAARARAEEVIERESGRWLQPVLRAGWADRPTCRTTTLLTCGDRTAYDLERVVRAEYAGGGDAPVSVLRSNRCVLNVRDMRPGTAATVIVDAGMRPISAEAHDAVMLLASWMLMPRVASDNATSESTDYGTFRLVVGGVGGAATSLPEVNAFIERIRVRDWQVG